MKSSCLLNNVMTLSVKRQVLQKTHVNNKIDSFKLIVFKLIDFLVKFSHNLHKTGKPKIFLFLCTPNFINKVFQISICLHL